MTFYSYHCSACGRWTREYRLDTIARMAAAAHSWLKHKDAFADLSFRSQIVGTFRFIFQIRPKKI